MSRDEHGLGEGLDLRNVLDVRREMLNRIVADHIDLMQHEDDFTMGMFNYTGYYTRARATLKGETVGNLSPKAEPECQAKVDDLIAGFNE